MYRGGPGPPRVKLTENHYPYRYDKIYYKKLMWKPISGENISRNQWHDLEENKDYE